MQIDDYEAFKIAEVARRQAYAPYSNFKVGAALIGEQGECFTGANVENVSFGLTMCAERVAIGTALTAGVKNFALLVITSDSTEPVVPCGACRQVLAEFNPRLRIISRTTKGEATEFNLATLLPLPQQGILD
jgi:cytidine deaminase